MADDKTKYDPIDDGEKFIVASVLESAIRAIKGKLAKVALSNSYVDLDNKPTYATVATSGSYNDLTDKPDYAPASEVTELKTYVYNYLTEQEARDIVNQAFQ